MSDLERMQGEYRWHNDSTEWCTVRKRDLALLLAVAEAAIAEADTSRIWKEANDNLDDTDEAWDAVWAKIDAAHDAFRAALIPLLEEVTE